MQPSNPACYECPKGKNGLHTWYLMNNGIIARCSECKLTLNEQHTLEVYNYYLPNKG